jgi:TatD DNase family protein
MIKAMQLIDTHAHIYLPEFDNDRELLITKAAAEGLAQVFMPAIDSSTHQKMLEVEKEFSSCTSMMGLHPCSVAANFEEELAIIENFLKERSFSAIGEIGLDFYWDKTFTEQQYQAFERQISWAMQYQLPIAIHSRNAMDECIEVVKKYPGCRGVFHCFSGTVEQAKEIIDAGFFLGIGGVITYKNSGLDKVIGQLGIDHLVLETDAPYLAPVPYRGKRNESSYLPLIAQKISDVTGKSAEEVAVRTTKNTSILFGFTSL